MSKKYRQFNIFLLTYSCKPYLLHTKLLMYKHLDVVILYQYILAIAFLMHHLLHLFTKSINMPQQKANIVEAFRKLLMPKKIYCLCLKCCD